MRDLLIKFYLPRLHESKPEGRRILQIISDLMPELMPEFYSSYEPINKKFDPTHPEAALEEWGHSFLWKRKKPSVFGMVTFGSAHPRRPFHTSLLIEARVETISSRSLTRFVQEFAKAFMPDIGLVHVFRGPHGDKRQPILQMSTFILKEFLPDLYWTMVFGAPYVELFGKERLLSTPAVIAKEVGKDLIYLQLTDDLMDNLTHPEGVDAVRQVAKRHLDSNAFCDLQLGRNQVYNTPKFHILSEMSPSSHV